MSVAVSTRGREGEGVSVAVRGGVAKRTAARGPSPARRRRYTRGAGIAQLYDTGMQGSGLRWLASCLQPGGLHQQQTELCIPTTAAEHWCEIMPLTGSPAGPGRRP